MSSSQTDLKSKYSKILKDNGIEDEISQVTFTKPDLAGEHMGSVVDTARVDFENVEKPSLELFLKKRLPSTGMEMMDEQMKTIMLKEGNFLKEFSQRLNELSKERSNGAISLTSELFPKTFYYDEDVIIMENLSKQGYVILPKTARQDFNTASIVVRHLAKLHAVSFVMVENAGGRTKFLESNPMFEEFMLRKESIEMMSPVFEPSFNLALEVLNSSVHEEKDEKYETLAKYKGKLVQTMIEAVEAENLFSVVLHGDCWNNNMMFDQTGKKVVLVDFQLLRVGSPNLDLSYFIFTSTKPEVRRRWKELLQIYFDSLKSNIESLGQAFEFKFEDFVTDFIRKSKGGFFFGFVLTIGFEAMEGHDATKSKDFTTAFTDMIRKWVEENPNKAQAAAESMISVVNDFLLFGEL